MRICLINYTPYGTQGNTNMYKLSQSLENQGEDVTVIGIQQKLSDDKHIIRSVNDVQVHELAIERDVHSKKLLAFCKHASEIINNSFFDIIHVFSFRGAGLVPLLTPADWITGNTSWIYQLIQVSFNRQPWRNWLSNNLLRLESSLFDRVITSNDAILQEVYGKTSTESDTLHVLPLGVDTERFHRDTDARCRRREELGLDDEVVLISVGSMNYERKLSNFLRGFVLATDDTDRSLHLLFVGDGEAKTHLSDLAVELDVDDRITFLGRVPFDQVPGYLSAADLGVSHISPTTPQSIQPALKVPEYLANGLPVLATETTGNAIYIEDGHNGFLYRERPDCIAEAIQQAVSKQQWKRMRDDCTASVQRFGMDELASNLITIYENI